MMNLYRYYLEAEERKHEIAEVAGEKVSASKGAYKQTNSSLVFLVKSINKGGLPPVV